MCMCHSKGTFSLFFFCFQSGGGGGEREGRAGGGGSGLWPINPLAMGNGDSEQNFALVFKCCFTEYGCNEIIVVSIFLLGSNYD